MGEVPKADVCVGTIRAADLEMDYPGLCVGLFRYLTFMHYPHLRPALYSSHRAKSHTVCVGEFQVHSPGPIIRCPNGGVQLLVCSQDKILEV